MRVFMVLVSCLVVASAFDNLGYQNSATNGFGIGDGFAGQSDFSTAPVAAAGFRAAPAVEVAAQRAAPVPTVPVGVQSDRFPANYDGRPTSTPTVGLPGSGIVDTNNNGFNEGFRQGFLAGRTASTQDGGNIPFDSNPNALRANPTYNIAQPNAGTFNTLVNFPRPASLVEPNPSTFTPRALFNQPTGQGNTFAKADAKVILAPEVIQKNFYYHVAQEDSTVNAQADTLTITPRKHYKIIFIKAPSASANAGSRSSAASKTEEKTIVYVLVNKPSQANADAQADGSSFTSGKPEVYFIKYQKPEAVAKSNSNSFATANADANGFNGDFSFAKANAAASAGAGLGGGNGNAYANAGASAGAGLGDGLPYNGDVTGSNYAF